MTDHGCVWYDPERKQPSTVWVFQVEPKPKKVVLSRSNSKEMVVCFFSKTGLIAIVLLECVSEVSQVDWKIAITIGLKMHALGTN